MADRSLLRNPLDTHLHSLYLQGPTSPKEDEEKSRPIHAGNADLPIPIELSPAGTSDSEALHAIDGGSSKCQIFVQQDDITEPGEDSNLYRLSQATLLGHLAQGIQDQLPY